MCTKLCYTEPNNLTEVSGPIKKHRQCHYGRNFSNTENFGQNPNWPILLKDPQKLPVNPHQKNLWFLTVSKNIFCGSFETNPDLNFYETNMS